MRSAVRICQAALTLTEQKRLTCKHVFACDVSLFLFCEELCQGQATNRSRFAAMDVACNGQFVACLFWHNGKLKLRSSAIRRFLPDGFADAFPGVTGSDSCLAAHNHPLTSSALSIFAVVYHGKPYKVESRGKIRAISRCIFY